MKTKYQICNLSCPTCASKIENALKTQLNIDEVNINLTTGQITLEHREPLQIDFISKASTISSKIEQGVTLEEIKSKVHTHHDHSQDTSTFDKSLLILSVILFIIGLFISNSTLQLAIYLIAYIIAGKNIFLGTIHNIANGKFLDENVLMLLASAGAFLIGAHAEGAITMILYVFGEYIQDYSIYHSQKSIEQLMNLKPETATLWSETGTKVVQPEEVAINDIILITPGKKIPLDGIIIEGTSFIDNSTLTGESTPIKRNIGDEVLSGGLVKDGVLKVRVTKEYSDSTIAKVLDMIANASGKKAKSEKMLTRFATYYTPTVVILASLLTIVPVLIFRQALSIWGYRSLVFLAASCPCSLIISIPLTYFAGLGKASRQGILIKGANYLEALSKINTIIFDKTGTLTKGNFAVIEINPSHNYSPDELLATAALVEKYSNHPIGLSIKNAYGKELPNVPTSSYQDISGHGIAMEYEGHSYLCGNLKLMKAHGINAPENFNPYTFVYLAKDGQYIGQLAIADEVKSEATTSIQALKDLGIADLHMFTGDRTEIANFIGKQLNISRVQANMLPTDKYVQLENLLSSEQKIAFVGDGINDASVIKAADVGIAMGNLGSDIAVESADIILSNDKLSSLVDAIKISRKAARILKQNLILSLGFKILVLGLGAMGLATMWLAIFADVGIMLIASLNALRAGQ